MIGRTLCHFITAKLEESEALIGSLLGHDWAKEHVTGRHSIRPRDNQLRAYDFPRE
jgi:hypothetical protein